MKHAQVHLRCVEEAWHLHASLNGYAASAVNKLLRFLQGLRFGHAILYVALRHLFGNALVYHTLYAHAHGRGYAWAKEHGSIGAQPLV